MNPTAQAALDRARRPTPAPVFSTEQMAQPDRALPMPVAAGPINQFMRSQARQEARELIVSLRATLAGKNGLLLVTNALKRAAAGRPGSHVQGFIDVIEWLEANAK